MVRGHARLAVVLALLLGFAACRSRTPDSAPRPRDLAGLVREGRAALARGDAPRATSLLGDALALAPEHPGLLYALARAEALAGDRERAFQHLQRTVALGFGDGAPREPAFRSLASEPRFRGLVRQIADQSSPLDSSRTAFILSERDLIPEGMAYDPAERAFYVGSL